MATLRQIFTRHVDLNAVPRRFFFQLLRHFVSNELEQEKLDEFVSVEGAVSTCFVIFSFEFMTSLG